MRRLGLGVALAASLATGLATPSPAAAVDEVMAGVGRADITSPTGYYMQGWVRSDAVLDGVHTRIQNRAVVLSRGGQKLALVASDLNGIAGGVVAAAAERLKSRGFSEANIIVSASHTHAAPSGYYPFTTYNTVFMTTSTLTDQNVAGTLDPQLYAFEVRQLVLAITRADDDLAPAKVGWATAQLQGLTANRSIEAHLRNHGVVKDFGAGKVADDPAGYVHTIDPEVQVLRVDKRIGTSYKPVGIWSTFADHGTVNKYTYGVYNADHHGSALRVVEDTIRREGGVPASQDVVNAYGNTDEGDQSAGLTRSGPAEADLVGRAEAARMLAAWRDAGRRLTATPELGVRWTRVCFCGQTTAGGAVSMNAATGLPLFTGSEEGRGPLYDLTQEPFEGRTSPVDYPLDPTQGHKIVVTNAQLTGGNSTPKAVPLAVARVGERVIGTIPGEMSVEMGRRVRAALRTAAPAGITGVQLSGLANEYLSYFVTPEEYDAQHYEGGSTLYGRQASVLMQEELVKLVGQLRSGQPATAPYAADPRNGVADTAAAFGTGASSATAAAQPATTQRLARAAFSWTGGPQGLDMPLGKAFVSVQRLTGGAWVPATDDSGLQIIWRVNDDGRYDAAWEVPRDEPLGQHRFVVTANHYRLVSQSFGVVPATTLSVEQTAAGAVRVRYPDAVVEQDITFRPALADGATVRRTGAAVPAGGARDRYGNCNGAAVTLAPGSHGGSDLAADPAVCAAAASPSRPVAGPAPGQLPATGGMPLAGLTAAFLAIVALLGAAVLRRFPER
ncbi:MAG: neutral/alkaline non-lysosomal ceramidase N-terminal domain-containing protein [Frankiaceae bacterium]|nr:neutral/alkaline non-lysosomal ceramidase N-terminal domain-containing protein [Frankiaceae bacterium]